MRQVAPRLCELRAEHTLSQAGPSRLVLCSYGGKPFVLKLVRLCARAPTIDGAAAGSGSAEWAQREAYVLALAGVRATPWVVALHGCLSTPTTRALLLEYLPGGNLSSLMNRQGALGHDMARFYIAETALGLEALHALAVAHRDVKPDNICIRASGHCALVDFGFSRCFGPITDGPSVERHLERSFSLLGTPAYLAPEIFLREGHGPAVDLWALGVTLYELLVDAMPFGGEETSDLYHAALHDEPHFPQSQFIVSSHARELIISLLHHDPDSRPRPADILRHPFFATGGFPNAPTLDVAALRSGSLEPPFVPRLASPFDVSHFADIGDVSSDRKLVNAVESFAESDISSAGTRASAFSSEPAPTLGELVDALCNPGAGHPQCCFRDDVAQGTCASRAGANARHAPSNGISRPCLLC